MSFITLSGIIVAGNLFAQSLVPTLPTDITVYAYGHSGIRHRDPYGDSLYWSYQLDNNFLSGFQFDFVSNAARTAAPTNGNPSSVGNIGISGTWRGMADVTDVFIITDNFNFPGMGPDENGVGDVPYNDNHDVIIGLWEANAPPSGDRRYWLYTYMVGPGSVAGWPGGGPVPDVDAYSGAVANWITYGRGQYQTHSEELLADMQAAHPTLDVRHMDVQGPFFDLLENGPAAVRSMSMQDWFEDDAPHGYSEVYLIAAMVHYIRIYGAEPPEITPPAGANIDPAITSNWSAITSQLRAYIDGT